MPNLLHRNGKQMSDSLITAFFVILSGGYQDAYSYCCRGGVFANAQTGNIVLMSINMFEGKPSSCMKYLIPLVAFLVGIYAAEVIHYKYKDMEKIHWRQIIVLCEIVVLFAVGFMPQSVNAAANALVSFVCALQLQTFHKLRGHAYASTMCIGNLRSGTAALSVYCREKRPEQLKQALYYFGIIFFFAIGAGGGGNLSMRLGIPAIWVSDVLLLISFILMFSSKHRD
jgi:uncharacterized membrane protein YoaK (UPF0700 family)